MSNIVRMLKANVIVYLTNAKRLFIEIWITSSLIFSRRKTVVFTTKYTVPRQLKDRTVELSIRKRQSNFSIVFIFC